MKALAKQIATRAVHKCYKHAAIVVRGGAIVSTGFNHDNLHAEVVALKKLWPSERRGTRLYSLRLRRDGNLGMAKPCPKCEQFLRENGVKQVFFTDRSGNWSRMKL